MKTILNIVFVLLFIIPVFSQESLRVEWEIEDNLYPTKAIVDNNGNTIILGTIRKINQNFDSDGFVFKMTPEGDYSYFRYISEQDTNITFEEIIQIDNGNYFVFSSYGPYDFDNPNEKIKTLIIDQDLNIITEKDYNLNDIYFGIGSQEFIQETDGNVLCAATVTRKSGSSINKNDLALYRFTQEGDTVETKFHHYNRNVTVYDIDKMPESENYLILEWTTQLYGDFECYVLKPDLTAESINFHNSFDYYTHGSKTCDYWYPDKTFLMGSYLSISDKSTDHGLGVLRCDTLANITDYLFLNKLDVYDNIAYMQCMSYADVNSIYIAGYMADYYDCTSPDSIELYVVDTALNQVAYKSLGGDMSCETYGVLTSKDGGAIIYGRATSPATNCYGNLVVYYVSRDELGLPPVKVFDIENREDNAIVFPNPARNIINIRIKKELLRKQSRIKLYNSYGKKVYDYRIPVAEQGRSTGNTLQLNISNLNSGVYIYEITNDNKVVLSGKFIRQ